MFLIFMFLTLSHDIRTFDMGFSQTKITMQMNEKTKGIKRENKKTFIHEI